MPRSRSSGRSAPSRPTVPSRSVAPQQQQTRPAATYAPAQQPHQPQQSPAGQVQGSSGPGLFGQMASTAAGVAVGSSIGHAIGNLFSGSGSSENSYDAAAAQQAAPPQQYGGSTLTAQQQQQWGPNCQLATQSFTKCMDEQGGNMSICGWYLEQLKQCQAAASRY